MTYFYTTFFFFFLLCTVPAQLFAAHMWVVPEYGPMRVYDEQIFRVVIDTEGETVNAVEGTIMFDPEALAITRVVDANSIINFWIEEPHVEESGVVFSGITPGGFNTKESILLSVVAHGVAAKKAPIMCESCRVLLHDGHGTEADVSVSPYEVSVLPWTPHASEPDRPATLTDREPPELFTPELVWDASLFNGAPTLLFATQDKGSGIDHYQVCEFGYGCLRVESPYRVKQRWLPTDMTVIAVDGNGNTREVILTRDKTGYVLFGILIVIIILGVHLIWKERYSPHTS